MKVCIFGLGSIGKRHIKVLSNIRHIDVIALRSGHGAEDKEFIEKYSIQCYLDIEEVLKQNPDFAIVANPTYLHVKTALQLAKRGIPFLLEKPVSHSSEGLQELLELVSSKNLPVLVGFQMRHHPGYLKMLEWLETIGKLYHCHGYVGQYLPDWRPGTDYRKNYSAVSQMGGGVILDLCHQIDISLSIMGKALFCTSLNGRCSNLEIETEDSADILLEHEGNRISHIHLNYLERNYEWYTRITGELGTIIWDYGKGFVTLQKTGGEIRRWDMPEDFDRDTLFKKQMQHWLAVLDGEEKPVVSLEQGITVTKISIEAKNSANEMRHIQI